MQLDEALSLAQTGHSALQRSSGVTPRTNHDGAAQKRAMRDSRPVTTKERALPRGGSGVTPTWREKELPFRSAERMRRDAALALDDPASWLTHGYTCAIHLKYLLERLPVTDLATVFA